LGRICGEKMKSPWVTRVQAQAEARRRLRSLTSGARQLRSMALVSGEFRERRQFDERGPSTPGLATDQPAYQQPDNDRSQRHRG